MFVAAIGIAHASLGGTAQRVTSVKDAGTGAIQVAFQYDGHGNVYRRTQGTFDRRFNYDSADRLVSITTNAGAMVADHVYDSFGRRTRTDTPVSGISNKNLRFQIYTPGGEFQWENAITWNYNGTGGASIQINYISLGGTLIAKQIGKSTFTTDTGARMAEGTLGFNPFVNPYEGATPGQADGTHGNAGGNGNGNAGGNGNGNAGGNGNGNGAGGNTDPNAVATTAVVSPETYSVEYVHTDALGSPVSYTSSTGSVLPYRNTRYEPYGTPTTTPRDGELTFTGHQYDTGTGLIYAQARYYDPALGRFLGPDPMAVDTSSAFNFNRYAYANNSPYKFTDPDGREAGCITLGTSCGFGSVSQAEFNSRVSTAADFTPVVGDIKGIVEAIQNPSAVNVIAAGVGLVPILGDAAARVIKGADKVAGALHGPSPRINPGQQGKHQIWHNNHTPGRSVLTADPAALGRHAGTGQQVGKIEVGLPGSKERVNFGEEIGTYVDQAGNGTPTTNGIIHYGSNGIHIVPARPTDAN